MPLIQESQPVLSPPLQQPTPAAKESKKALKRLNLERSTRKPSRRNPHPGAVSSRSPKTSNRRKHNHEGGKLALESRHRNALSVSDAAHCSSSAKTPQEPLSAGPTLTADSPSTSGWRYTGSAFHEQLREEYLRFWLPWRSWVEEYTPGIMNNRLFLSERARAEDWVEQMFESWFLAGYGCSKARYEYPGMESD